ncbi:ABC transporter permease subunit [Arthrobacter wenxiniae]|uniref:ABC transporter permease n=1 Tax=Arthrobacter wenxiniae TaxID=2713570 RepID=A0A7Y7LXF4_9MICC|nr:ABC transporter permease [Arthrobacter wenxiniae]
MIVVFIVAPLAVVAASSFTATGYVTFPPKGFSLEWYVKSAQDATFVDALWVSLRLGTLTTFISVVAGVLAAYGITYNNGRLGAFFEQIFLSPIMLPGVVLGLGILFVLSASGWRGTFEGGVLAHVIVACPFVTRAVLAGLRQLDPRLEEASRSLGAGPVHTFLRIVVPSVRGSIIGGAVFAFVISFDEAVVTLFLTGPTFSTLPVTIFTYVQYSNDPTIAAVSTVIVVFCVILVGLVTRNPKGRHDR